MTKQQIINSIHQDCNVRLKPSTVCDGVGVFAIKPIANGTVLFKDVQPDTTYITYDELTDINVDVISYLTSLCNSDDCGLYLSRSTNNINITYFINHSDTPNVAHNLMSDVYYAITDIAIGDELVCEYSSKEFW
jgi:SET domain-containing protein